MKRFFSGSQKQEGYVQERISTPESQGEISPELAPIITLLSAQSYRRYNEGTFLILKDLDSEGRPADRVWKEVYGVLIGVQLAVWDAQHISLNQNNEQELSREASKPSYVNFTDASFKAVNKMQINAGEIENVIVVSTTLKNRYLIQVPSKQEFIKWVCAFRLATFEYTALQEAYTAALLSARGSYLSDIRVVLAETKYEHEEWISVRFGVGAPWKKCFTVVEPATIKKNKFVPGRIRFYQNEKKGKKAILATIVNASAMYAVYPQSPVLIDKSTMIKLDGSITFAEKEMPKEASIFLMPDIHSSVPLFDTLIRFLIPSYDTFGLYGRPKKLNADKSDPGSLLFGLPVLPRVHYLEVNDLLSLGTSSSSLGWDAHEWGAQIKRVLQSKLQSGYDGCGSQQGLDGAMSVLNLTKNIAQRSASGASSPHSNAFLPTPKMESRQQFSPLVQQSSPPATQRSPEQGLEAIYKKYAEFPKTDDLGITKGLGGLGLSSTTSLGLDKQRYADTDDLYPSEEANIGNYAYDDDEDEDDDKSDALSWQASDEKIIRDIKPVDVQLPRLQDDSASTLDEHVQPALKPTISQNSRVLSPYSDFHDQFNKSMGDNVNAAAPRIVTSKATKDLGTFLRPEDANNVLPKARKPLPSIPVQPDERPYGSVSNSDSLEDLYGTQQEDPYAYQQQSAPPVVLQSAPRTQYSEIPKQPTQQPYESRAPPDTVVEQTATYIRPAEPFSQMPRSSSGNVQYRGPPQGHRSPQYHPQGHSPQYPPQGHSPQYPPQGHSPQYAPQGPSPGYPPQQYQQRQNYPTQNHQPHYYQQQQYQQQQPLRSPYGQPQQYGGDESLNFGQPPQQNQRQRRAMKPLPTQVPQGRSFGNDPYAMATAAAKKTNTNGNPYSR